MPPWVAKEKMGTLLLASEMSVPIPRNRTVDGVGEGKPRYEAGGEAQALVRPARDRGLPLPKTCEARVVA